MPIEALPTFTPTKASESNAGLVLADWVLARCPQAVTHLKLQKLCFYAYGALLSTDGDAVPVVSFEAWKHGPVCADIYRSFAVHGAGDIEPREAANAKLWDCSAAGLAAAKAAVEIYGRLSPWELREESHLESIWQTARALPSNEIAHAALLEYFRAKFAVNRVELPRYLVNASAEVDGIPAARFANLEDLAAVLARAKTLHP